MRNRTCSHVRTEAHVLSRPAVTVRLSVFLLLALLASLAMARNAAAAEVWRLDPDHSAAHFSIRHMMIAKVRGMFPDVSGGVAFEDGRPVAFDVTIGVQSLDTGVSARDEHLRSKDFFEAKTYPVMRFVSTKVAPMEDGSYRVTGTMTIKSVSREISVTVTGFNESRVDPWKNTRRGGGVSFSLDRSDYDITWNAPLDSGGFMVGNTVKVNVDMEVLQPK